MDDEAVVALKKELNNLIWMHSPKGITLEEAERRSCLALNIIRFGAGELELAD